MGNELTTRNSSAILSTDDFYAAIAAEASTFRDGGGMVFLKFDGNTGEYSYGADNTELALGSELALNMLSYKRGWICWNDGEVVDEVMVSVNEGPPPRKSELKDHGPYVEDNDGWSEQYTIEMRMMDEPHTLMLFQANNSSKRRAFEALVKDFAKGFKSNPDCAPVIEIDEREFEAKGGKDSKRKFKKHAPVFKIIDWVPLEELNALVEGSPDDYEDEAETEVEAKSARRRPEPEEEEAPRSSRRTRAAEPDDEDEAPRSSRRTRAAAADEDEAPRARRSRDEDDEDEAPRSRAQGRTRRGSF